MARVKINFPSEKSLYQCTVKVRINDLNYGGHVGNDSLLGIIHDSRMQMLHSWGMNERNADGCGMIMADVMIAYKNESFFGDDLHIEIWCTELSERSFDLLYRIYLDDAQGIKEIAHAKTAMVMFNYEERKIGKVGALLRKKLETAD